MGCTTGANSGGSDFHRRRRSPQQAVTLTLHVPSPVIQQKATQKRAPEMDHLKATTKNHALLVPPLPSYSARILRSEGRTLDGLVTPTAPLHRSRRHLFLLPARPTTIRPQLTLQPVSPVTRLLLGVPRRLQLQRLPAAMNKHHYPAPRLALCRLLLVCLRVLRPTLPTCPQTKLLQQFQT